MVCFYPVRYPEVVPGVLQRVNAISKCRNYSTFGLAATNAPAVFMALQLLMFWVA